MRTRVLWVVQDVLLSDVQLSLAKLADPHETLSKANTLERLLRGLSADSDAPLEKLNHALDEFRDRCVLIKGRRNRELAHTDLATLLHQYRYASEVTITLGPSRQKIEEALAALRNFMDLIKGHLGFGRRGREVRFQEITPAKHRSFAADNA
jgi:hypothetical protein